jgi:hypothetical protein
MAVLGSSKMRQQVHPPDDAGALADIVLQDADGTDQRLGDLWGERPVVLVWLRHYG